MNSTGVAGVVGAVASGVSLVLAIPALVLLAQVVAAVVCRRGDGFKTTAAPGRTPPARDAASRPLRLGVLMPAHDEALGIAAALASVRAQLEPGDRLLVVADNCADDTAGIAASAGAEVTVRNDPGRRGKGYALDHGVRHLAADPVDVVVVVDADCELHAGSLRRLAVLSAGTGRPTQALYLMLNAPSAGVGARVSEFAWRVRNQVRPLGGLALGWPCQLMGTGMAFPWAAIVAAPLASGHLVEDMELGLALAAAGTPPLFCPDALVTSRFADDAAASRTQRTRWEHGHLAMIVGRGLPTLARGLAGGRPALVAMALDLGVPPLASLVAALVAWLGVTAAIAALLGTVLPAAIASGAFAAVALAVALAWARHARDLLTPAELGGLPRYVLAKLPIYFRWITKRQTDWVRTRRDASKK